MHQTLIGLKRRALARRSGRARSAVNDPSSRLSTCRAQLWTSHHSRHDIRRATVKALTDSFAAAGAGGLGLGYNLTFQTWPCLRQGDSQAHRIVPCHTVTFMRAQCHHLPKPTNLEPIRQSDFHAPANQAVRPTITPRAAFQHVVRHCVQDDRRAVVQERLARDQHLAGGTANPAERNNKCARKAALTAAPR